MSSSISHFLNELSTAVFEPSADVFVYELFSNVFVLIFVESWVTGNADDNAGELRIFASIWGHGKDSEFINESKETNECKRFGVTRLLRSS